MPLDARIPLGVQPLQIDSPLVALTQIAQLQQHRAQAAQQQAAALEAAAKRARQAQIDQALQASFTVDPKTGRPTLDRAKVVAHLPGHLAYGVMQELDADEKNALDFQRTRLDLDTKKRTYLGSALQTIRAADYDPQLFGIEVRAAQRLGALDDETAERLLGIEDPAQIKALTDAYIAQAGGEAAKTPAIGSFEDYARRYALSLGKAPEALTPEDLVTAKGQFEAAGRAPATGPNIGSFEDYVLRDAAQRGRDPKTYTTPEIDRLRETYRLDPVIRVHAGGGGSASGDRADLVNAVIENPGLWDQITPTERGKIAGELQRRGFTGFGKPLSDAAVGKISETKSAIASLADLREVLKKNEQYLGPVAGLAALNPYSAARQAQADVDRVRQRVGKALEGGVLRKEDEEKYKKILATLRDVPETALYKIDQLAQDLQRDIDTYAHQQRLAGRRVPQSETPSGHAQTPYKVGDPVTIKGKKYRVTKLLPNGKYEAVAVP